MMNTSGKAQYTIPEFFRRDHIQKSRKRVLPLLFNWGEISRLGPYPDALIQR